MIRWRSHAAVLLIGVALAGCASTVDWRYYAPFRVIGKDRAVAPVDPAEVSYAGVASRLHYVSITVDSVFFRNLPGAVGQHVALGIELDGAVRKSVKTVSEPVVARGPQGKLLFERPFSFGPFLYRGLPLRLTLIFRDVTPAESKNLVGRLQGLGLLGARILPKAVEQLKLHATQFEAFLGSAHKDQLYKYTFSLYPSDMEGVRRDLVLTGGRHVFIGIPSSSAPATVTQVRPADLVYKLRLVGRRLEWREGTPKAGKEYTESPYVLLSIIRYKRYPSSDTALRKADKRVDKFIEDGNWKMARASLVDVGQAILDEKGITQLERNLEIARRDARAARIETGEATAHKDRGAQLKGLLKQIRHLGHIGKDFQQILEPFEVKDLRFRIRRLSRQASELASELSRPAALVAKVAAPALASIHLPPEPPKNPLTGLKPPEVVTVTVTKPEPFYKKWWFYALLGVAGAGLVSGGTYAIVNQNSRPAGLGIPTVGKPTRP